jgi:hypothetical protein
MLAELAEGAGLYAPVDDDASNSEFIPEQFAIVVECKSEREQLDLLERFSDEGLTCRALLS